METLGSTNVIASDKTGTLTANEMRVVEVALADGADEAALWERAVLCNDADIDPDGDAVGDPTEVALLLGAQDAGVDWRRLRDERPRSDEVPFDPTAKRMAVVANGVVYAKGAPEVLLDPDSHRDLSATVDDTSGRTLRTLAIAAGPAPDTADEDELFRAADVLGVVGIIDSPRPAAIDAVKACHTAGIRVVMITGDVIGDVDVDARVAPEHELRLVRALQFAGGIVAVTGDGVNDAPALRQADVGVAMGRTGTDVAREAADIVLTTDDFSTIERAVEEGRRIFENIRRFGQFLFSWHLSVVLVVTAALVLGMDAPLAGLMILWKPHHRRDPVVRARAGVQQRPSHARAAQERTGARCRHAAAHHHPGQPGRRRRPRRLPARHRALRPRPRRGPHHDLHHPHDGPAPRRLQRPHRHRLRFRGATGNPYLWGALALTITLEAIALTVPAVRDLLDLTLLDARSWATATALASP
ncbi:MAG TPA: HAD-IC family P-type ATPase [Acidimicrobiales bacterium]